MLLVSFLLCSFANNNWYLKNKPRSLEGTREVANWLQKQGCNKIIAKFWEGNSITEYSNGAIEVYVVNDFENYSMCTNLQDKRNNIGILEKNIFVVTSIYDDSEDLKIFGDKSVVVYEYGDLVVSRIK